MSNTEQDTEASVVEIDPTWTYKGVEIPDMYYLRGYRFCVRFGDGMTLRFFHSRDLAAEFAATVRDE